MANQPKRRRHRGVVPGDGSPPPGSRRRARPRPVADRPAPVAHREDCRLSRCTPPEPPSTSPCTRPTRWPRPARWEMLVSLPADPAPDQVRTSSRRSGARRRRARPAGLSRAPGAGVPAGRVPVPPSVGRACVADRSVGRPGHHVRLTRTHLLLAPGAPVDLRGRRTRHPTDEPLAIRLGLPPGSRAEGPPEVQLGLVATTSVGPGHRSSLTHPPPPARRWARRYQDGSPRRPARWSRTRTRMR
jgi:hypothetical protein